MPSGRHDLGHPPPGERPEAPCQRPGQAAEIVPGHRRAGGVAHALAQRRVAQQLAERLGQRGGVLGRDQQTVDPVLHDLRDASHRCRDHRRAAGHRLDQNVGDAVPVSLDGDPCRQRHQRRPAVELGQPLLGNEGTNLDPPLETGFTDHRRQPFPQPPLANDDAPKVAPPTLESGAGLDQQIEALLGRQPADGEDQLGVPLGGLEVEEAPVAAVHHPQDLAAIPLRGQGA